MFNTDPLSDNTVTSTGDLTPAEKAILVVDDDEDTVQVLTLILGAAGYKVFGTTNPEEVPDILRRSPCRAAFVDLWMPGTDGVKVLKRIRQSAPGTMVIIMTAAGDWETYMECLAEHALEYVQKPVRRAEVLAIVEKALQPGQAQRSSASTATARAGQQKI